MSGNEIENFEPNSREKYVARRCYGRNEIPAVSTTNLVWIQEARTSDISFLTGCLKWNETMQSVVYVLSLLHDTNPTFRSFKADNNFQSLGIFSQFIGQTT